MIDETKMLQSEENGGAEEKSSFDFASIYRMVVLNWQWFIISVAVCAAVAFVYLRYATPVYNVAAKLYIKTGNQRSSSRAYASLNNLSNLGVMDYGIHNEQEILVSSNVAVQAVKDLKLYTSYWMEGRIKGHELYKNEPITVDLDPVSLDKLNAPIGLEVVYKDKKYHITGTCYEPVDEIHSLGPYKIEATLSSFPASIKTKAGVITFAENKSLFKESMKDGQKMSVSIVSPRSRARAYAGALSVGATTEGGSVLALRITGTNIQRGKDYLNQLVICYNKQANDDKNEISMRTEDFINGRLSKISAELGETEGELESYKRSNQLVGTGENAGTSVTSANEYEKKLAEANTQISLINSLVEVINESKGKYEILPVNIGISDNTATSLISTYNQIVLERNQLLRTAAETNPSVTPLTMQLDNLQTSIRQALAQAKRVAEIQRESIISQLSQYNTEIAKTPEQERILTQIGRQQGIKADLYLTLLQKREENSISLAATSEKSKLIESPEFAGKVSPQNQVIMLGAVVIGLCLPLFVLVLINFFRFRIEGRNDVERLTSLPIVAEIAVANDKMKTKGDIVVHENQNNTVEEVFRSLRANIRFIMKEGEKTIMFTSSLSGEGKTFVASNLAISFAFMGKKVILAGLDIRKPRLSELFEIHDRHHGITNLLVMDDPQWSDIDAQIIPSGVSNNLDLLMAGPIPPNPAEIICSQSLETVIERLKEHYDFIILDTAPVGLVSDTLQIGRVADMTAYVCRADFTPKKCFNQINELARNKKMPNIAIIINGIDMSKRKHRYNYGYGNYGLAGARYGDYSYGSYGSYGNSHYGNKDDDSIKK